MMYNEAKSALGYFDEIIYELNKSFIGPSLNYLSKMNAPCIRFHSSAFIDALQEELWNN